MAPVDLVQTLPPSEPMVLAECQLGSTGFNWVNWDTLFNCVNWDHRFTGPLSDALNMWTPMKNHVTFVNEHMMTLDATARVVFSSSGILGSLTFFTITQRTLILLMPCKLVFCWLLGFL